MGLATLYGGDGVRQPHYDETQASTAIDIWIQIPNENVPAALDDLDRGPHKLGWAQSINENYNRPTTVLRMLDKNRAGRIAAQKPSPENWTISLQAFETYKGGLPERLSGMVGTNLFHSLQSIGLPLWVIVWDIHPADSNQQIQTVYGDCWLTRWAKTKNIGTITVAGTLDLTPSWVETFDANEANLPENKAII